MNKHTRAHFLTLDAEDQLAQFREEFNLPDDLIYLDGNSLGAMPKTARKRAIEIVAKEWGQDLISSWNKNNWFNLSEQLGQKVARLIGADSDEVMVCDSTGLNLYKCLSMALEINQDRNIILMEGSNFPTDNYMAQGLCKQLKNTHRILFTEKEDILPAVTDDVAVVCLTQVHYKMGHILDMQAITEKAHQVGTLVIWDLCHSTGAIAVDVNKYQVDFAIGCTYKYLNGGPGSPAYIFVARRHQGKAEQPRSGWWGHATPFAFEQDYRPAKDIWQTMTGTQPILSLAVLDCGLDITLRANIDQIRKKSVLLTDYFISLVEEHCGHFGLKLASPRNSKHRGSQVSFYHPEGYAIIQALIAHQVVGDFRAPDIIRFGFTPLYTRYVDVWDAVICIKKIMQQGLWKKSEYQQKAIVT